MRSSMIDTTHEDYVRRARAKGVPDRLVRRRHVVPNAFLPTFTLIFLSFGFVLGGAIVIEAVFSWPGLGLLTYNAIKNARLPGDPGGVPDRERRGDPGEPRRPTSPTGTWTRGSGRPEVASATVRRPAGQRVAAPARHDGGALGDVPREPPGHDRPRRSWSSSCAVAIAVAAARERGGPRPGARHRADLHAPPQAGYPLGTDNFGRSVLDLLIAGTRVSLLVGVTAAIGAMVIGAVRRDLVRLLRRHEGRHGHSTRSRTGSS